MFKSNNGGNNVLPVGRMAGAARRWLGDWGGKLTLAYGVLTLAYVLYLIFRWGGEGYVVLVGNVTCDILYFGPCLIAWRASRQAALPARARRAWLLISLGYLCYVTGGLLWTYYENVRHEQPFPSWADAGYLPYYPLMLFGLLSLVPKLRNGWERARFGLDAAIILVGGGMVLWYFIFVPMSQSGDGDPLTLTLSLAYPVADLVLLLGIAAVSLRRSTPGHQRPLNIVLAGISLLFMADFIFGYQNVQGIYKTGNPVDALYTISAYLVMLAAHYQWVHASAEGLEGAPVHEELKSFNALPYVAIAAGYGMLLKALLEHAHGVLDQLEVGGFILTALVVSRQLVSIREREKVHAAFRELQERVQGIYDASKDAIGFASFDGTLIDANEALVSLTGYSKEELLGGKRYQELTPPEYHLADIAAADTIASLGQPLEYEKELLRKDGSRVAVALTAFAIKGNGGHTIGLAAVIRDITEREAAQEAVRRESALLHALMDNIPDAIFFKDTESRFTRVNRLVPYRGGNRPEEVVGKTDFDFFVESHARAAYEDEQRVMKTGVPLVDKEECETYPDGSQTWLSTTKVPILDEEGRVTGLVGISRDITTRKRAERELERARDAALESARLKSEFLANMSHEIRTPMNGIIGMTELTLDTELDSEQRDYLRMVKQSADSLLGIINDVLDFSKIEAGRFELDPVDFDLAETVAEVLRPLAMRAEQKGLELTCQVAPGVPAHLNGDAARLRQILVNLVGNAIKFTEEGEVSVLVDVEPQTAAEGVGLNFQVRDTGIGVEPGKHALIFEAFAQADGSTTRSYGGTGLGLTITSQLVSLMGGRIWVESPGQARAGGVGPGSVFHFTLRLGLSKAPPRCLPAELSDMRGQRVLVVDDNATNRRIMCETLAHWQLEPHAVASGPAALAEMESAAGRQAPYRLVLLDAQMPELDGFLVAEKIRKTPELAGATIMMLTSTDQYGQSARCRELGLDVYLVKPVCQPELLAAVRSALGVKLPQGIGPALSAPSVKGAGGRGLRVLLAEDNQINQHLALRVLEKRGHTVDVVGNGRQAVDLLAQRSFDIVLMDLQMPEMNGLDATAAVRRRESAVGRHTPIIAMTAYAMKGDRERCLAAGMDAYISKPIDVVELLQAIEDLVPAPDDSEGAAAAGEAAEGEADFPALIAHAGGDVELAHELAEIFLDNCPKLLSEIGEAVARGDAGALERAAHTANGALVYFSSGGADAAALRLQQMGQTGDLRGAEGVLAKLDESVGRLKTSLAEFGRAYAQ